MSTQFQRLTANAAAVPQLDCNPHRRIPALTVCDLCGGISDMTLWRWLNDTTLGFPRPIYIGRRRYWREADVLTWLESRQEVSHATA
ncbi:hypothetical protein E4L95_12330 [Paracoccus liaowanqingii]|uniref:AlpA family phage regulatory protein n=1 Tax=Paracoccus liaowanqingii TaxID=2560053 RepID=A0A4Z1BZ52_9RHOB|nr:hypothetical protein [Paracoccus liaowanqingii]TGN58591.1 hypothetical protein E4L95_12330 [Paracoccus liaowanqingii]